MKIWIFIAMIFLIGRFSFAEVAGVLSEIMKPTTVAIGEDRLYVGQDAEIFIYNLKDLKFIKKFGKRGEGPAEFPGGRINLPVTVSFHKDLVLCNSVNRVTLFSKDGDFIKMIKGKGGSIFSFSFQPVGDHFVGMGVMLDEGINFRTIDLYDGELNKIKTLAKIKLVQGQNGKIKPFHDSLSVVTDRDKIFIASQQDFSIFVLDTEGETKHTIQVDKYERVKCTDTFREEYFEAVKANPTARPYLDVIKQRTEFPDYFPAVAGLFVTDDLVYVITWRREGEKVEFFLFDTSGSFKSRFFVTFQYSAPMVPYPAAFKKGKLFQVVENQDEQWELHVTTLH